MTPEQQQKKQEEAQMAQAVMMAAFKRTDEYALLENTLTMMEYNYYQERQKAYKSQDMVHTTLYLNGKEDAIVDVFEAINKIIADGEAIRDKNALIAAHIAAEES